MRLVCTQKWPYCYIFRKVPTNNLPTMKEFNRNVPKLCLLTRFLILSCQTWVGQTENNTFQPFEQKKKRKKGDLTSRPKKRERDGKLPAFPVPFYCHMHVWNVPTKAEDHLIPVFRLSRSNFWQAVMCNHHWITRTPMDWSNTVGRRVVRLWAKTAASRKNQHWGRGGVHWWRITSVLCFLCWKMWV